MINKKDITEEILSFVGNDTNIAIPFEERKRNYERLAPFLNEKFGSEKYIEVFKKNGYLKLGKTMTENSAKSIFDSLHGKDIYNGHVPSFATVKTKFDATKSFFDIPKNMPQKDRSNQKGIYCFNMYDLLHIPEVVMACYSKPLIDFATEYLECPPVLYSVNLMISINDSEGIPNAVNKFHRDFDDFKSIANFTYLTDTDEDSGSHIYKKGTHIGIEEGEETALYGKTGSSFITDPYGLHRGVDPKPKSFRALLWTRYGMYENFINRGHSGDHQFRIEIEKLAELIDIECPKNQYFLRLITK